MKILLLAPQPFYQERGTPIAVRLLAEELQAAGCQVDLLVFNEGEDIALNGAQIHRTCKFPGLRDIGPGFSWKKILSDLFMLQKAFCLAHRNRYDLYHAVEESVFIALLLKFFFRRPCIYDVDSWMSDQLIDKFSFLRKFRSVFLFLERIAVRKCDAAIVVCKALENRVRLLDQRIPVLRLEDVCMAEKTQAGEIDSLHTITGRSARILLYAGNLESYQGIDLLLNAFALLCRTDDDADLVFIGGTPSTIAKYTRRTEELQIATRVFFIGARPLSDLGGYLRQADLLISPRISGTNTPMKLYSYMGSGRAIVATQIESHTQVLDDSMAYLAQPEPEAFMTACQQALCNAEERERKGKRAAKSVEENFSRKAYRKKLLSFYKEMTSRWGINF